MARQQPIIGIDVGTTKITTIVAVPQEREESLQVVGAATVESQGIKKSQIVDIEEATKAITQSVEAAERMAGFSITHAFVSVGGVQISSKNSTGVVAVGEPQGEIVEEDVCRVIEAARAISLPSSQEIIHVLPRQYTVDAQEGIKDPVGMSGIRLEAEAHIVTGSSTAMRNVTKCIIEIGIHPDGFVFSGLASSDAVLTPTEKELGVVLVDIGGGTSSIAIWIDGSLAHSAVLPVGARNITNDLAIGMRLSLDAAEKVKHFLSSKQKKPAVPKGESEKEESDNIDLHALGIGEEQVKTSRKTLVDGIIRPRLQEIFTMVGMELRNSGFGGRTPAGVVLTGGGAKTIEIVSMCKRVLSLPTRVGFPKNLIGLIDDIQDTAFAVSEGLVLYGSKNRATVGGNRTRNTLRNIANRFSGKGVIGRTVEFLKQFLP